MKETIANINTVRNLLSEHDLKAKKKYGQNFLVDVNTVMEIMAEVEEGCFVIEIGPGLGALTQFLAEKAYRVIAYEIDSDLVAVLKETFRDHDNVEIRNEDFTKVDINKLLEKREGRNCYIVSNLPYYITTDLLTEIFISSAEIRKVIVMMQKEVGQRFVSRSDVKDYNAVNVLADLYSDYDIVCRVNRHAYFPAPNVDSVVLKFDIREHSNDRELMAFIEDCFTSRRKVLSSVLKQKGYAVSEELFRELGYSETVRVEELKSNDFVRIYEALK